MPHALYSARYLTIRVLALFAGALLTGCASTGGSADNSFSATYRCDDGQHITAVYLPPDRARIAILDETIDMHIARSADGARYVGGNRVWWTKGSGPGSHGMLFKRDSGEATGAEITTCVQIDTLESA